jgi:transposase InsO family protein
MRAMGLKAIQAKKFKVTTDSNHSKPVAPDLIKLDFGAQAPNEKWVSDINCGGRSVSIKSTFRPLVVRIALTTYT